MGELPSGNLRWKIYPPWNFLYEMVGLTPRNGTKMTRFFFKAFLEGLGEAIL